MTPSQPNSRSQENHLQFISAIGEYSRGCLFGDTDLSAINVSLALHLSHDPDEASGVAVTAMTDLSGFACQLALFFQREESSQILSGRSASLEDGSTGSLCATRRASLTEDLQRVRISIEDNETHHLVQAMMTAETREVTAQDEMDLVEILPSSINPSSKLLLIPAVGQRGPVGVMAIGLPQGIESLTAEQLSRYEGVVKHLALAIERIGDEAGQRERVGAYETIRDLTRGILTASNLPDIFQMTTQRAAQAVRGGRAFLWIHDEANRSLTLAAQYVARPSDLLDAILPRFQYLAETCTEQAGRLLYPDLRGEEEMNLESLPEPLSAVVVPLLVFGEIVGVLAVVDKRTSVGEGSDRFTLEDENILEFLASQTSVAVKNTRLYERLKETEKRLTETQKMLTESEKMAALGELSAKIAQELRDPIAAIGGFAKRIERELPLDDPSKEDVRILVREAKRLEEMVSQQLEVAEIKMPRKAMRQLNTLVHESVVMIREELVGQGIFLEEAYAREMPDLLLDEDRTKKVVLNILRNALDVVKDGDTVRIETLREGDRVLLEIANTGDQPPGNVLEELFMPFSTGRPSGRGLGLAIANQIIREHGGEISIRNEGDWGAIFTISFPIRANQERRRVSNRRGGRDRRRDAKRDDAA